MDWTPFYVTFAVLLLACWLIPATAEEIHFRLRCWWRRRRAAQAWERQYRALTDPRTDHPLPTYRHDTGVRPGDRICALSVVSAKKRRLDDFNDAA